MVGATVGGTGVLVGGNGVAVGGMGVSVGGSVLTVCLEDSLTLVCLWVSLSRPPVVNTALFFLASVRG
ncbi:MAG: hypothetical protein DSY55_01865, partial [Clostridia bacterium]